MAVLSQVLLVPLLFATTNCWPYPWLQHAVRHPRVNRVELVHPYYSFQLQNIPYGDIFGQIIESQQLPNLNNFINQIPIKIDEHPAYIDDQFFPGFSPDEVNWWDLEKPFNNDLYTYVGDDQDSDADQQNDSEERGDDEQDDSSSSLNGYDENSNKNENNYLEPIAGGSYDEDEELAIDARKDEAKFVKPH